MGFYLYDVKKTTNSNKIFNNPKKVSLAGKFGPINNFMRSKLKKTTTAPFTWHLTLIDILSQLGLPKNEVSNRAIVIDLKPKAKTVELYLLKNIWGYTENDWTPIAIHLEELYTTIIRTENRVPSSFKTSGNNDIPIIEFLYLHGGLKNDSWSWGPVGSVNGTLLWPQTFEYFLSVLPRK